MGCVAWLLAGTFLTAPPAETIDTILQKHVEARGGMERLSSVRTLRAAGRMRIRGEYDATFTTVWARPQRGRIEVDIRGRVSQQGFDGNAGWQLANLRGASEFVPLPPEVVAELARGIDVEGPLVDPARKGNRVRLVGLDSVEGTAAWNVEVMTREGEIRLIFLDTERFLEIKEVRKEPITGLDLETTFSDYKSVDGLWMPYQLESALDGRVGDTTFIESIELNVPVDETEFTRPDRHKQR